MQVHKPKRISFKHRVQLILRDSSSPATIYQFYFESLEQAGVFTFLCRRCLMHPDFDILHEIYKRGVGYVTVGNSYTVQTPMQKYASLSKSREKTGSYRVKIEQEPFVGQASSQQLVLYTATFVDALLVHTLLSSKHRHINHVTLVEQRNTETSEWETCLLDT